MRRAALVALLALTSVAHATEGGGTARLLGLETILSGVMSPPGSTRFSQYFTYYRADRLDGSDGRPKDEVSKFDLSAGGTSIRWQHVWQGADLWGANLESRMGLAFYVAGDLELDVRTPMGTVSRGDRSDGLGDLIVAPVLLGWHAPTFHQVAGLQFFVPTGKFDADRRVNPGRGYFTVGPQYWFTWFPAEGVELSGTLAYLFNAENRETDYRSGQELGLDWGADYRVASAWHLGASGYLYKQVTDDKVAGRRVGDGNRGQGAAAGPSVRYRGGPNWGIVLKWQREWAIENRPRGDRVFAQFSIALP